MMRATEPSNMIWENRHTTNKEIYCRSMFVAMGVIILLGLAFALFTVMMHVTVTNQSRYPPSIDCKAVDAMFPDTTSE